MQLVLQNKENSTIPREIPEISIDAEGTPLVLKYKGLHDSEVCADIIDEDTKMQNDLLADASTRKQLKQIRTFTVLVLMEHLSSWNIPNLKIKEKNIDAVLKEQTALWEIRNDFIDLVTESALGVSRSEKEAEVKNLMSLAGHGSSKGT